MNSHQKQDNKFHLLDQVIPVILSGLAEGWVCEKAVTFMTGKHKLDHNDLAPMQLCMSFTSSTEKKNKKKQGNNSNNKKSLYVYDTLVLLQCKK